MQTTTDAEQTEVLNGWVVCGVSLVGVEGKAKGKGKHGFVSSALS